MMVIYAKLHRNVLICRKKTLQDLIEMFDQPNKHEDHGEDCATAVSIYVFFF